MMIGWNEPVMFLARSVEAIGRLAPIYLLVEPEMRGAFLVPETLTGLARELGVEAPVGLRSSVNRPLEGLPPAGTAPMVTCRYRDLVAVTRVNSHRANIYVKEGEQIGAAEVKVHLFVCRTERVRQAVAGKFSAKDMVVAGESAWGAAEAITAFVKSRSTVKSIRTVNGRSVGIVYMAFGEKAARAVSESAMSLRRVGLDLPVCVVGSTPVPGFAFVQWNGETPFDGSQKPNFQFRAGRIKPSLYDLSPFEQTLYIDADTEFMGDILPGFEALKESDAAIARENLTLGQLYNKALAGWEINIQERDATIAELGEAHDRYFLNSGVLFFRKSPTMAAVMRRWHEAWLEWEQWDEQLALMRAFHRTPEALVQVLDPEWNYPHRKRGIVIFHNYGRGVVRMNVGEQRLAVSGQLSESSGQLGAEVAG